MWYMLYGCVLVVCACIYGVVSCGIYGMMFEYMCVYCGVVYVFECMCVVYVVWVCACGMYVCACMVWYHVTYVVCLSICVCACGVCVVYVVWYV